MKLYQFQACNGASTELPYLKRALGKQYKLFIIQ